MNGPPRLLRWAWLGRVGYGPAVELMEALRDRVLAGDEAAECLLFLEHDPVVTLGRSAHEHHVLATPDELSRLGIDRVRTNRGGLVTVHGPGQLVIYPVVRLTRGVVAFLQGVASAICDELASMGIPGAEFLRSPTGVWVGGQKIAACGIHVRHGIAVHGFALNVTDEPLSLFRLIIPCGLAGGSITTIARLRDGSAPTLRGLAGSLAPRIAVALGREGAVETSALLCTR